MRNSRGKSMSRAGVCSYSRRDVLVRSAKVLSLLALPQFVVRNAHAATTTSFDYYLSPNGSDANPGTLAAPWAITSLQDTNPNNPKMAGKRIGLLPGNYSIAGMTSGSQPGSFQYSILAPPCGSATSPTYVASCSGQGVYSPRTAIITWAAGGSTNNSLMGPNPTPATGYVTIDGLVINANGLVGPTAHIVQFNWSMGSFTAPGNVPGCVVQNCELYGLNITASGGNYACVFLDGCNGAIVQNCYLHDVAGVQADHTHAHCEYASQNTQFLNNTVTNCTSGVESKVGTAGCTVAYNYFHNVANPQQSQSAVCQGFDGGEGNPNTPSTPHVVHHNVFDGCGLTHLDDYNGGITYQGIIWYNNTTYDTRGGSNQGAQLNSAANLITYYNNIIFATANSGSGGANPGELALARGGYTLLDYNCYYGQATYAGMWGLSGTTYSTLASWQSATGADSHAIAGNPQFNQSITSGGGPSQFQLANGSPCIGAGRVGGSSSAATCNMGAWDGTVTQIGCNFTSGATGTGNPIPAAPTLSVS